MKIIIRTKNITLAPALNQYLESKIKSLEKLFKTLEEVEARVEIEKTTKHHKKGQVFRAECQIKLPGKSVRAESLKEDLRLAIDEIKDNLFRELNQYKNKTLTETRKRKRFSKECLRLTELKEKNSPSLKLRRARKKEDSV